MTTDNEALPPLPLTLQFSADYLRSYMEGELDEARRHLEKLIAALSASPQAPAVQPDRKPDGYAYFYPGPLGGLRFNHGQEVNGSKPERAVPYFLDAPPAQPQAPAVQLGYSEVRGGQMAQGQPQGTTPGVTPGTEADRPTRPPQAPAAQPGCGNTPYDEGPFTIAAPPAQPQQAVAQERGKPCAYNNGTCHRRGCLLECQASKLAEESRAARGIGPA